MQGNESVVIRPAHNVLGSLRVPGDKSISHRYAMLAALAPGRSRFENYSPGADCGSTLGCVRALGCTVERDEKGDRAHDRRRRTDPEEKRPRRKGFRRAGEQTAGEPGEGSGMGR